MMFSRPIRLLCLPRAPPAPTYRCTPPRATSRVPRTLFGIYRELELAESIVTLPFPGQS